MYNPWQHMYILLKYLVFIINDNIYIYLTYVPKFSIIVVVPKYSKIVFTLHRANGKIYQ